MIQQSHSRPKYRQCQGKGFKPYRLEVLTPVFVSSGDPFDPLDYIITQEGRDYYLYLVDFDAWVQAMADNSEVNKYLEEGSINGLRLQLNNTSTPSMWALERVPFISSLTAQQLRERILKGEKPSTGKIMSFTRNPVSLTAYLPGSSIKGAMSTPILDYADRQLRAGNARGFAEMADKNGRFPISHNSVLAQVFGEIRESSMQGCKIYDVTLPPNATAIMTASEVTVENFPVTAKDPCEALRPGQPGIYGALHLDSHDGQPGLRLRPPSQRWLPWSELQDIINNFYKSRFEAEFRKFYEHQHADIGRNLGPVFDRISKLDPQKELLLRVGHYSHIESVTMAHNRPAPKIFGKARTLANGEVPFGWMILRFCDMDEYSQAVAKTDAAIDELIKKQLNREKTPVFQAAPPVPSRKEEEAENRKRLDSLPPHERLVAILEEEKFAIENRCADVFNELDNMEADIKIRAANAVKKAYIQLGKWEVRKKTTPKQKEKVNKIKGILGEN